MGSSISSLKEALDFIYPRNTDEGSAPWRRSVRDTNEAFLSQERNAHLRADFMHKVNEATALKDLGQRSSAINGIQRYVRDLVLEFDSDN